MAAKKLRIGGWVPSPGDTERDPQVTTLLPQLAPVPGDGDPGSDGDDDGAGPSRPRWLTGLVASAAVAVLLVGGATVAMLFTRSEPAVFVAPDPPASESAGPTPGREPTAGRAITQGRAPAVVPAPVDSAPRPTPASTEPTGAASRSAPADPESVSLAFEAETGALSGGAVVLPSPAASGGQVVQFLGSRAAAEYAVTVPTAGRYTLTIFYLTRLDARATLTAGGERVGTVDFPATGRRSVGSVPVPIELPAGESTVRISTADTWAPALDRITLTGQ